ncbi:MAG: tetratricopeptide repeat protein [Opitutaceae bacterium]|nr:tetratricopeptide repeat protein [Opitutaceae bacterium]
MPSHLQTSPIKRPPRPRLPAVTWAVVVLLLAGIAAYWNTFSVPFLFDDDTSIADNPTIRSLWPPAGPLSPPSGGETVTNRPVLNYSFALNYALGGLDVRGYHVLNLAIHLAAALALFGVVRRTLRQPVLAGSCGEAADRAAFVLALWWLLHPLQTESVTYIVQRAESLMGLFYLLTLYAAIRGMAVPRPWGWWGLAWVACTLGMATKEVMASAPLVVFLYDRTFVAGTFREAWTQRKWSHLALASTWLVLVGLAVGGIAAGRGGTAGLGAGITWWDYLRTQAEGIVRYLQLSFWPAPLVFDYGVVVQRDPVVYLPCLLFLVSLAAATVVALRRWPVWGFAGVCFFAILAPSSSVIPVVTQTLAEHRMYLPLAVVLVPVALGLSLWMPRAFLPAGLIVAGVLGVLTFQRNHDYRTAIAIWGDTVAKRPQSARAHSNFGTALARVRENPRIDLAIVHQREAVRLDPEFYMAHHNLAKALKDTPSQADEAIVHYRAAARLKPEIWENHLNLAVLLQSRPDGARESVEAFESVVRFKPDLLVAHTNLGILLTLLPDRLPDAVRHFTIVAEKEPDSLDARYNLAVALARLPGREAEALREFRAATRLAPNDGEVRHQIAKLLIQSPGRRDEALAELEASLRLNPNSVDARFDLARVLAARPDRVEGAVRALEQVLAAAPDHAEAKKLLARIKTVP